MAFGVYTPIIKEGDDLESIILESLPKLQNGDIIGITESVVARAAGLYITVDDIANDIKSKYGKSPSLILACPIYSRNRFAMILKGIARACKKVIIDMPGHDEVGNPSGVNPFTGIDIKEYYKSICESEKCKFELYSTSRSINKAGILYCGLRDFGNREFGSFPSYTLADICSDKNPDFGVLGSNKATEEKLKLFPTKAIAQKLCDSLQEKIFQTTEKSVEVMVYGDGCFKDPIVGIWEFADPVTSPGYTKGLEGTPNELKLKALADDKFSNLTGSELTYAIKDEIQHKDSNLVGKMSSQGTTPRRKIDLLASLMDLISGSGDAGTPVVIVRDYNRNYANS